MQPLHEKGADAAFDFGERCVLSVAWPTENTGYSNLFLDNEGQGWGCDAEVVFNFQAARDCWKRLNDALAARPQYVPSQRFQALRAEAQARLAQAKSAGSDADRGKHGQVALDQILQAYETLLRDYGIQRSKALRGRGLRWGFTLDRRARFKEHCASIKELVGNSDNGWIRIVCDRENAPPYYQDMVNEAKAQGLHVLLQVLDSVDNRAPLDEVEARVAAYVDFYKEAVDAYEIGNEVNMEDFPDMPQKLEFAAQYVRDKAPGAEIAVVLFWQLGSGFGKENGAYTLFHWINHKALPSKTLMENVDVWHLSMYHEGYPMGAACLDEVATRLQKLFPGKKIGLGELDYWMKGTDKVWRWRRAEDPTGQTRREFFDWHYAAMAGYERSVLGGFWWGFIQEMQPPNELWQTARQLYCEMNPQ
jgi:hypothetical protein